MWHRGRAHTPPTRGRNIVTWSRVGQLAQVTTVYGFNPTVPGVQCDIIGHLHLEAQPHDKVKVLNILHTFCSEIWSKWSVTFFLTLSFHHLLHLVVSSLPPQPAKKQNFRTSLLSSSLCKREGKGLRRLWRTVPHRSWIRKSLAGLSSAGTCTL